MRIGYLLVLCTATLAQASWSVQRLVGLEYPLLAQQAQIQGTVDVACRVGADGDVLDCSAVSGHPLLQTAAIANAKRWRFRRADSDTSGDQVLLRYEFVLQGEPVRHRPKVEFTFEYPALIRLSSEIPCADHVPCTADEQYEYRKNQQRSKSKRSIP